jgi:hypothetical protein
MAIRFNCTCGVLLEVDDGRSGQSLECPDCKRCVRVPSVERTPQRTSGLAIASLTLALVGAFTIVGTLLAVVLGVLALVSIARQRDRLAGESFAISGILLGVVLTGMSLFAYSSFELFGVSSILREVEWAGKLDYSEPMERPIAAQYSVIRPSKEWGEYRHNAHFNDINEFILVNVRKDAFVTCLWFFLDRPAKLEAVRAEALACLQRSELFRLLTRHGFPTELKVLAKKLLPTRDGLELFELQLSTKLGRRSRKLLVQLAKEHDDDRVYVIVGGTREEQFDDVEPELRQILDSFKIRR